MNENEEKASSSSIVEEREKKIIEWFELEIKRRTLIR